MTLQRYLWSTACAVALLTMPVAAAAQPAVYEIRVTNAMRGESLTPVGAITHVPGIHLFQIGDPAPSVLEAVAEEGNLDPLFTLVRSVPQVVYDAQMTSGLTGPGQTSTLTVKARPGASLTLVAMLIPTNDGFIALNGVVLPRGFEPAVFTPVAYDAGTEINDELCASIPGPNYAECGGPGGGGAPAGGEEGFVHVHAGIHGVGDFVAADRDWRNPIARVVVRRIR
ncbi:MAG: spondin domain-containing protein [Vicinamibacterales bacterium]